MVVKRGAGKRRGGVSDKQTSTLVFSILTCQPPRPLPVVHQYNYIINSVVGLTLWCAAHRDFGCIARWCILPGRGGWVARYLQERKEEKKSVKVSMCYVRQGHARSMDGDVEGTYVPPCNVQMGGQKYFWV